MKIIFRMEARNMLPDAINKAAQMAGRHLSAQEHRSIRLKKEVEWSAVPRTGDEMWILPQADYRSVESVIWGVNGVVEVVLEELDTDEVAEEEGIAVEELLGSGWEIDWD